MNKEQVNRWIKGRRSLYPRQYTGETIENGIVQELLELANTAPNHKLTRPWKFHVFSSDSKDQLIDEMKEYFLEKAGSGPNTTKKLVSFDLKKERTSHIIAIVMKRDEEERIPEIEEVAAVSCAVQNIYLALEAYGLGGYWSTGKYTFTERATTYLGLGKNEKLLGFFYLGVANVKLPIPEREPLGDKVIWKQ